MKSSAACMCLVLLASAIETGLLGQPVMAHCESSFLSAVALLMQCRPAIVPFLPAPPSEVCCNALRTLGQPCLCVFVNGPPITGMDRNAVLQLPAKCTVSFEPCDDV